MGNQGPPGNPRHPSYCGEEEAWCCQAEISTSLYSERGQNIITFVLLGKKWPVSDDNHDLPFDVARDATVAY